MKRGDSKKKGRGIINIFVMLIVLMLFGGIVYLWAIKTLMLPEEGLIGYQAVFLDNGQTYFGKVSNKESVYVRLSDVYYLQFEQSLQDQGEGDVSEKSDLTLVKLGSELHGPEDEMEILRDHILFIENLADNSKVAQAIVAYKNKTK